MINKENSLKYSEKKESVIRLKKKKIKVQNPFRRQKYLNDLSDTYYYECRNLISVGRLITTLIKEFKKLNKKQVKGFYILNPQKLVFCGSSKSKHRKYFDFYQAGSWTKGPFIERSPKGLFKYLLRRNLLYKTRDKSLYKKICVFSEKESSYFKTRNSLEIKTPNLKEKFFCKKVGLKELFNRI